MICLYCHEPANYQIDLFSLFQKQRVVCEGCERELLPDVKKTRCRRCSNLTEQEVDMCVNCEFLREMFVHTPTSIFTVFDYNTEVQQLFHRYKFVNDAALSAVIAHFIQFDFSKYDLIIPIPVSAKRLRERTYNQVTLVLQQLNVTYHDVLITTKVKRQSELSKRERIQQKSTFHVLENQKQQIKGANILLVDDIFTTGITVHQAIQVLYAQSCNNIDVLTFSRS